MRARISAVLAGRIALAVLAVSAIAAQPPNDDVEYPKGDSVVLNSLVLPPILLSKFEADLGIGGSTTAESAFLATTLAGHPAHLTVARNPYSRVKARSESRRRYFITDLGSLGGSESFAYAVNDRGQVVGLSRTAGDSDTHAFLYEDGLMTDLSLLNSGRLQSVGPTGINIRGLAAGGVVASGIYLPATFDTSTGELTVLGSLGGVTNVGFSGVATAVNDYGLATGYSYTDPLNRHGFLYADGMMVDIGSLGGYSAGLDINRAGVIVGFSAADTSGRAHAFVFKDGFMTDIDPHRSDMSESYARGINSRGTVVGEFLLQDQSAFHAFLYRDGVFRDIGVLDSPATVAFAINDEGHVVGTTLVAFEDVCFDPSNGGYVACTKYAQSAFVYRDGLVSDLNALIPAGSSIKLEWAIDINNRGRIVGYGSTDERFRAFLLTPAVDETQCKRGAWASFGFKDDRQCIQFVSAGK